MTLEEAIKHAEEVADEKKEEACNLYDDKNYEESRECIWCAEEHRQLVEWLKDYKRLLEQEPKYCDRNICVSNEYNGISCDECEVTKSQEPETERVIKMRDATPEEQKSVDDYVKSISKPTGVNFWNLEQEPTDLINRQAVIEQTYNWSKDEFLRVTNPFDYLRKRINSLPSVKPQEPKEGCWIEVIDEIDSLGNKTWHYECSICRSGNSGWGNYKYCPDCGAKMKVVSKQK